jgi:hypothetical protein
VWLEKKAPTIRWIDEIVGTGRAYGRERAPASRPSVELAPGAMGARHDRLRQYQSTPEPPLVHPRRPLQTQRGAILHPPHAAWPDSRQPSSTASRLPLHHLLPAKEVDRRQTTGCCSCWRKGRERCSMDRERRKELSRRRRDRFHLGRLPKGGN